MTAKKCCCNIKLKYVNKSHKMEGDFHGERWTKKFVWEEGVDSKILIVGYVQFVERRYPHANWTN